jgi:hypothetical protein
LLVVTDDRNVVVRDAQAVNVVVRDTQAVNVAVRGAQAVNLAVRDAQAVNFIGIYENLIWLVDQEQKQTVYQIVTPESN